MPEQTIPFANREASGLAEIAGASPMAFNVVTDETGAVHRRPGLRAHTGFEATSFSASAIAGLWSAQNGSVFAVDDAAPIRRIYRVAGSALNLSTDAPSHLLGTGRPQ